MQKSDEELCTLDMRGNKAGNCPDYSMWATICTGPEVYDSLCLSIANEVTMQCCGPCQETAKEVVKVGISISDH